MGKGEYPGQGIIDFVGDPSCELTDTRLLFRLQELCLALRFLTLIPFAEGGQHLLERFLENAQLTL